MPNAPSDPAETARVLVETAHRVLDQAHPAGEKTVRVALLATVHKVTVLHAMANVVPTAIDRTVKAESAVRTGIARSAAIDQLATVKSVSGSPARVATANHTVTASPMGTVRSAMTTRPVMESDVSGSLGKVGIASPTVTVRNARALLVEIAPVTRLAMVDVRAENAANTSLARVMNVVSGSPVKVETASRLATAPMVSVPAAMRGSVAPTVTVPLVTASVANTSHAKAENAAVTGIARSAMVNDVPMAIGLSVMVAIVVRTVIAHSAGIVLNTGIAHARMSAESAMSVLS